MVFFAKALDQEAVDYIYELKRRPRDKALNLNVADEKTIRIYSKNQPSYLTKLIHSFFTRASNYYSSSE